MALHSSLNSKWRDRLVIATGNNNVGEVVNVELTAQQKQEVIARMERKSMSQKQRKLAYR